MKNLKKGFTLVELMVVIVIIGVLAALAIPRFLGASNKAKAAEFKPVLKQIYTLNEAYKQERDTYAGLKSIGFDVPKGNSNRAPYFTYTTTLGDTATGTQYTATATLQTTLGDATATETVIMSVNDSGSATNTGSVNLSQLANWK